MFVKPKQAYGYMTSAKARVTAVGGALKDVGCAVMMSSTLSENALVGKALALSV